MTLIFVICYIFQALAEQQQFKNAEDYLTRGLNIEPDNANIYVQKG